MAESRPLQSHCHLGSKVGSGPTNIKGKTKYINKKTFISYKAGFFPLRVRHMVDWERESRLLLM